MKQARTNVGLHASTVPAYLARGGEECLLLKRITERGEIKLYKGDGSFMALDLFTCGYSVV
jgi:hypothetical protein